MLLRLSSTPRSGTGKQPLLQAPNCGPASKNDCFSSTMNSLPGGFTFTHLLQVCNTLRMLPGSNVCVRWAPISTLYQEHFPLY